MAMTSMERCLSTRRRLPQLSTSTVSPEERVKLLRGLRRHCWGEERSGRPEP
jgi:hypothetical protein